MSFLKQTVFTVIFCLILQLFLPWWTLLLGSAVAAYWQGKHTGLAFLAGFVGVALLWFAAAWWIDMSSQSVLSARVATLFGLSNRYLLMLITAVLGGLTGGFAALTGYSLKASR